MLVWFLPTFLWSGQELDETDRPFKILGNKPQFSLQNDEYIPHPKFSSFVESSNINDGSMYHNHLKRNGKYTPSKRIATIIETVRTKTTFSKVYNRLLCPQCIARLGLINGVLVSLINVSLRSDLSFS